MPDYNPSQYPTRKPREEAAAEPRLNSEFAEPGSDPTRGPKSQLPPPTPNSGDHWRFSEGDMIAERFTVTQRLGRGGMGEVYAVVDQLKNEPRALKVMRAAIDGAGSSRERFLNESRVDYLRHPHIVRTIDIGEWKERNLLYITMELVDGQSLRQLMKGSEQLSVVEILTICYQVCEALQFAHQHGVIHRDVKPDNVLVKLASNGLHAWLTDFGIARLQTSGITQTVAGLGTPVYVAPEQLESAGQVTGQADLYSVGAMLYDLLTGQSPVGFLQPPSTFNNELPKGADDLIFDAMSRLPEHRICDAGTMAARIGKLLKDLNQDLKSVTTSQVDPASINLGDLVFEIQPRKAPQVTIEGVPGIPEEILELEGKRDQLQQTLELIEAGTHPLVKEHQVGLQQLSERVTRLQELYREKMPTRMVKKGEDRLRQMILAGETQPSNLLKILPSVNPGAFFQYVELLINTINAEQTLIQTQKKYDQQIRSEIIRLGQELQITRSQLQQQQLQDLEKQIRSFFKTFRKQHPHDISFPYSAWGKFQEEVLAKRRYQLTSFEITMLSELCFDPRYESGISFVYDEVGGNGRMSTGELWGAFFWSLFFIVVFGNIFKLSRLFAIYPALIIWGLLLLNVLYSRFKGIPLLRKKVRFNVKSNQLLFPDGTSEVIKPNDKLINAQTIWAKHLECDIEIKNSLGMKFRIIPPGKYLMGSPESEEHRQEDEYQHPVWITKPYYLATTVVTQKQWKSIMGTTPWKRKAQVEEGDSNPATFVNWNDAQQFIGKLNQREGVNYRLPTEAEWEYACRAGSASAYAFGKSPENLKEYAWFNTKIFRGTSETNTHPVAQKQANGFGIYDLHGNILEWCQDWYEDIYYLISPTYDPSGPNSGSQRVTRGGCWGFGAQKCRSASRNSSGPLARNRRLGFRIVMSPTVEASDSKET
ncbi:bifunctional serine/threonine-protein kinase/formylglycine-generating enzyme family protein [Gimesia sp.]|uniref:bifunctional serine/threonine-protein kinase/formylglycine-generating enzyme family protein n=1 Tax=Gimesia sp. TaxID=2024833 RepID=UPI003A8D6C0D